mmetsp:Transcript_34028/g.102530  ORF Transcript_34028/g.102530 Transcript_34028/m.102530 type:complete len:265 (-) Transcript_34028:513-1307(-)
MIVAASSADAASSDDVTKNGRPTFPRFEPNVNKNAYSVGAITLIKALSAFRSAASWPCGTPNPVPSDTIRADVACWRPAPSAMGPSAANAAASVVARPSNADDAAAQPVVATVWPRGPKNRSDGPVSSVPAMLATPAMAAKRPHCAAPQSRSSRARTCQRSPMPLVSDCSRTTAFSRASRGPRRNKFLNARGWNAFVDASRPRRRRSGASVSGAAATRPSTQQPSNDDAPYARRTSRAARRPPASDAMAYPKPMAAWIRDPRTA